MPRVILDKHDSSEKRTVLLDGSSIALPNINRMLLLLAQLQPGRQGLAWGGVRLSSGLWLGVVVVEVGVWWWSS